MTTSQIRDRLRDLAEHAPDPLAYGDLAATAWSSGRRRRVRRRLRSAAVGLVVIGIVVGTVLGLTSLTSPVQPTGGGAASVDGYPVRIAHQWWTRALPDRPGPVAGLLQRSDGGWDVVAANGHRWRSPQPHESGDQYPTLSRDGRFLAYLGGVNGPFVIRDLVTGRVRRIDGIGCGCSGAAAPLYIAAQSPSFWSPDDKWLVFPGGSFATDRSPTVLVGPTGPARPAPVPASWTPAGWAANGQIVWTDRGHRTPDGRFVNVRTTDLSGRVLRTVQVRLPTPAQATFLSQSTWTVSPDGRQLLFDSGDLDPDQSYLATYLLADGSLLTTRQVQDSGGSCFDGWAGTTPVVPRPSSPRYAAETVAVSDPPHAVSVTDPQIGSDCVVWTVDALAGTPHSGLFGTSTATWTWWWREAATGLVVLALAVLAGVTRARRHNLPRVSHDLRVRRTP